MLRLLVLLLFLANLLFYAWTNGWLDDTIGIRHDGPREPMRLARQLHPEAIEVLPYAVAEAQLLKSSISLSMPSAASQVASAASRATDGTLAAPSSAGQKSTTQCVQAGPLNASQRRDIETSLAKLLPAQSWDVSSIEIPGMWMVYMGRYTSEEALRKKAEELRRIANPPIEFIEVRSPAELNLGISLGRYTQPANAEAALAALKKRGVRTARIVAEREAQTEYRLRVPAATAAMQQSLKNLNESPQGVRFEACDPPPTADAR